jgi:hypothetical protein
MKKLKKAQRERRKKERFDGQTRKRERWPQILVSQGK